MSYVAKVGLRKPDPLAHYRRRWVTGQQPASRSFGTQDGKTSRRTLGDTRRYDTTAATGGRNDDHLLHGT